MTHALKIAQVAPFEESVPPPKYGGTELVISNVTEELVRRGYQVTLLAAGDSKTSATLVPIFKRAVRRETFSQDLPKRDAVKFIGAGRVEKIRLTSFTTTWAGGCCPSASCCPRRSSPRCMVRSTLSTSSLFMASTPGRPT